MLECSPPQSAEGKASHEARETSSETAMLTELYRHEASPLARRISRRGGSEEAEDLVQDAFVRLIRVPGRYASLELPVAYLRRIAGNLVRDHARLDARRSRLQHVVADDDSLPPVDPHAQLESRDMLRRVEAAMQRLPDRTREIFLAHRVEGLSYAEIATRTGMSVKGVEKQMSKALVRIDRLLARS